MLLVNNTKKMFCPELNRFVFKCLPLYEGAWIQKKLSISHVCLLKLMTVSCRAAVWQKETETGRKLWKDVSPCRTPRQSPTEQTPSAHQAPLYSVQETTKKENKVRKVFNSEGDCFRPLSCIVNSSRTSTYCHFKSLKRSMFNFHEFCFKGSLKTSRRIHVPAQHSLSPSIQINWDLTGETITSVLSCTKDFKTCCQTETSH